MTRLAPALLALFAAAPLAAQDASDFQLPPSATTAPDSRAQGPVDTEGAVPVRPRVIETARPTPSPTAAAPAAGTAPPGGIVLPAPRPARPEANIPRATVPATPASTAVAPPGAQAGATPAPTATSPSTSALPPVAAQAQPSPAAGSTSDLPTPAARQLPWLWLALAGVALAVLGAALFLWRRRGVPPAPAIMAPRAAAPRDEPGDALSIAVEAMRMDRSVLNATVGYRVTIRNRTAHALVGVAVEADLVSASGDRPAEQQLASPEQALTPRHAADRLAPGQSLRFEGQARLPLAQASAIWQGRVSLLVPLLRVRATADGSVPVATTLVIGRAEGQAARPQPFRLDEPPRSYAPLAQRVLHSAPARG
ncbi:MAG: hypothetical protein JNJ92_01370 [Altererythrobacter sp.]|nr:hypothetical protein [Altererythrobacter sp.]